MKRHFPILLIAFIPISCGVIEELAPTDVQSKEEKISRPNCSQLADEYDSCIIKKCEEINYSCLLCSCMESDGSECKYSSHKKLDDCSEEEDEEASYMLGNVSCSEFLEGFEKVCPPPEANTCKLANDPCFTSNYEKGICIKYDNNYFECVQFCSDIGYSYQCPPDTSCYLYNHSGLCISSGEKREGESCEYVNECVANHICLQSESSQRCYKTCKSNMECSSNKYCADTGLGFSVCVDK